MTSRSSSLTTTTGSTTPPGSAYQAHIDGLRALAVISVLIYHLDPNLLSGGFVGVDVFFVISGYVVTASLADHRSENISHFLGQFYARRLARLIPALVTMLVVTTALYVLFVPRSWANRAADTTGQAAFWGLSNWSLDRQVVNYFDVRAEMNPFTHTWSLGIEEQFYLLCPLMLFVALGTSFETRRRQQAIVVIAALAVASLVACYYFGITRGARFVFFQITFRFWELATGVLLFLAGPRLHVLWQAAPRLHRWPAILGLSMIALVMLLPKPGTYPWVRSTVAVLGTMLLIGVPSLQHSHRTLRTLTHPVALWIGQRSYSLYLWHWPIFVIAGWTTGLNIWPFNTIAVVLSFALAAVSYRFIECPIRYSSRLKQWNPAPRIGIFLVLILLGWMAGGSLIANQPRLGLGQSSRSPADWYTDQKLLLKELGGYRNCSPTKTYENFENSRAQITTFSAEDCKVRSPRQLFAIGDSHTGAYHQMLEQISAEQGRVVRMVDIPGCAYVDLMNSAGATVDSSCADAHKTMLRIVLSRATPGDVVFLSSLRLPRLIEIGGHRRRQGTDVYARTSTELAGVKAAASDAPRWILPLLDAGLKVIFELPKPIFRVHPFQCVDWFNKRHPDCSPGITERRADQERYRAPAVEAGQDLASKHAGIIVWDPLPDLCEQDTCSALRGARPLFFDGDHLSPYGNLVLLPSFKSALKLALIGEQPS